MLLLTVVHENMSTYLLDFAYFVFTAPSLPGPAISPDIEWGRSQTPSTGGRAFFATPSPPQIISKTRRRSETSEAAFESDRLGHT